MRCHRTSLSDFCLRYFLLPETIIAASQNNMPANTFLGAQASSQQRLRDSVQALRTSQHSPGHTKPDTSPLSFISSYLQSTDPEITRRRNVWFSDRGDFAAFKKGVLDPLQRALLGSKECSYDAWIVEQVGARGGLSRRAKWFRSHSDRSYRPDVSWP